MGNCMQNGCSQFGKCVVKKNNVAIVEYPDGKQEVIAGGGVTVHQLMSQHPGFYVIAQKPGYNNNNNTPKPYSDNNNKGMSGYGYNQCNGSTTDGTILNDRGAQYGFMKKNKMMMMGNVMPTSLRFKGSPNLLPPDATLSSGKQYRLVSFEEVFLQFSKANKMEFLFSPRIRSTRKMQILEQQQKQKRNNHQKKKTPNHHSRSKKGVEHGFIFQTPSSYM